MPLLTPEEQNRFDQPPIFTSSERKHYLHLTASSQALLANIQGESNQVCFLVSLGYFKARKRFYAKRFHEADLRYAASQLNISFEVVKVEQYAKKSFYRHRRLIAEHLGFELYSKASDAKILPELQTLIRSQKRPKVMLEHLAESLIRQRIEVPSYFALTTLILREVQTHKQKLLAIVRRTLTEDQKGMLEKLFEQEQDDALS